MNESTLKLGEVCWVNFRVVDLNDEADTLVFECRISRIHRHTIETNDGIKETVSYSVIMVDDIWEKEILVPRETIHRTRYMAIAFAIAHLEERNEKARVAGLRRETLLKALRTSATA